MSDEPFDRVQQLFLTALELPAGQREPWLVEQCGDDQALFQEIRSLLKHDSPGDDPLENPFDEVIVEVDGFAKRQPATEETVHGRPSALHVRCPHCHNPIELIEDAQLADIDCPSCGSSFSLLGEDTLSSQRIEPPTIAHFVLQEPVGMGAFGSVWKAHDETLDRVVAIKIPRRGQLSRAESEQFLREAKSTARLKHANIVAVHEVGRDGTQIYIVSDFIDGKPLSGWLTENTLTPKEAAKLTITIAEALHHAHEAGVIHRDLKPSNIMMDTVGEPHLVDFGLAKRDAGEITMTVDGKVLGTPAYMSPEQARGEARKADRRTDVYSLGVILFEILTGERPFRGEHRMLLQQVIHDEAQGPRKLNASVPRDLDTICLKCLEKKPARRYATSNDLASDLRKYVEGRPISARPISSLARAGRWCKRNPRVAILATAVFMLLFVVAAGSTISSVWLSAARKETQQAFFDLYTRQGIVAANQGDHSLAALWFMDAAILSEDAPQQHLASRTRAREFGGLSPRPIGMFWHDGQGLSELELDPSDQYLSTLTHQGRCTVWSIVTQKPIVMQHGSSSMAWSADRRHLAIGLHRGGILLFESGDWARSVSIDFPGPVTALKFSPDSQQLAIGGDSVRLWSIDENHFSTPSLRHPEKARAFTFDSTGDRLAVAYEEGHAKVFDLSSRDPSALSRTFEHRARIFDDYPFNGPLFIDAGKTLVTNSSTSMYWSDLENRDSVKERTTQGNVNWSAVSPNGEYLATCGPQSIQLWDSQSANELPFLGQTRKHFSDVHFSPDGTTLVMAFREGFVELVSVRDRDAPVTKLQHSDWVRVAKYSPSGKQLATGQNDGLVRVWDLESRSRSVKQIRLDGSNTRLKLNGDGTKFLLAGSSLWGGTLDYARVFDVATGSPLGPKLNTGSILIDAAFSPDGNHVVTANIDNNLQNWDWRQGNQTKSAVPLPLEPRAVDFDPLGKKLIVVCTTGLLQFRDANSLRLLAQRKHGDGAVHAVRGSRKANEYYHSTMGTPWFRGEFVGQRKHLTISKDSRWLVTTTFDNNAHVWDLASMKERYDPLESDDNVFDAKFSEDQSLLVTLSGKEARVWDFESGKLLQTLSHSAKPFSACFHADGRHVLTACEDGAARLWDWESGLLACPPMQHESHVQDAAFMLNSDWIITSGNDSTVRVWEPDGGQPLSPPITIAGDGLGIVLAPDEMHALISCGGQSVHVIRLDHLLQSHESSDADAKRWAEIVAGRQIVRAGEVLLTTSEMLQRWGISHLSDADYAESLNRANLYLSKQNWRGARLEYRHVLNLRSTKPVDWLRLMDVTWWDDWTNDRSLDDAMAIYQEARNAQGEGNLELGVEIGHASWCLLTDQQEEYERVCRIVVEKHLNSNRPRTLFQVAKILALGEQSILAPDQIVKIARKAIEADPTKNYFRTALAHSLIRAGEYEEALVSSDEDAALLALTHARMGNADEARKWLQLAREEVQDKPLDPRSTWFPTHRMAWRLYLRETERLLAEL